MQEHVSLVRWGGAEGMGDGTGTRRGEFWGPCLKREGGAGGGGKHNACARARAEVGVGGYRLSGITMHSLCSELKLVTEE